MQIVECTKRNSGDTVDRRKGEVRRFEDRQTEQWDIVVSAAGASSSWVLRNAPLPNAGSPHPDNNNLICTGEHQISRVEASAIHFQATVTYEGAPSGAGSTGSDGETGVASSAPGGAPGSSPGRTGFGGTAREPFDNLPAPDGGGGGGEEKEKEKAKAKPEKRRREPYSVEWSTVESQEPIDTDISGDPICTILGEQFDPPLTESVFDVQYTEGFNRDEFHSALQNAVGQVNADTWKGYRPGQARITSVQHKWLSDDADSYYRVTVTVQIRVKKAANVEWISVWDKRVRAEGYKVKDGDNIVHATDDSGDRSAVPVLHRTDTGAEINDPKDAQWYIFETVESTNFRDLRIG